MEHHHLIRKLFTLGMVLGLSACTAFGESTMDTDQAAVIRVAEKFVSERYADFDKTNKKLVVKDAGDYWEATYELPEDMIGGAPVLIIDKRTKEVIRSFRTQ